MSEFLNTQDWRLALLGFLALVVYGVIKFFVDSYLGKNDTMKKEEKDRMFGLLDRTEKAVQKLVTDAEVNKEKMAVVNHRLDDLEINGKDHEKRLNKIEVKIGA